MTSLHEALYYRKLRGKQAKEKIIQCNLCPHFCAIKQGFRGNCGVRQNNNGILYSLVYGKPCSVSVDPIEKKPFYHFLPGSKSLSIATVGCNLHCLHCQNYAISQAKVDDVPFIEASPEQIIQQAKANNVKSISFTYTEPTIFYEYMLDIAKLAKKEKIKCNIVSNGFINPLPLKKLCSYIKAANIDLKGNALFYEKVCGGRIEPVLESLKLLHQKKVHLEITNLVIPGYNDNIDEIKKMVSWILENLGDKVPLHFSAFYPCYKLTNIQPTSPEFLIKARVIAKGMGLKYVYTGNISDADGSVTSCDKCSMVLIKRHGFNILENNIKKGKCKFCGNIIPGVFR